MADSPVVRTEGLVKTFGATRALDGFDLEVPAGEIHGFLGPNGAGKSTTIRILLGLLRATAGEVTVLGADPWHDAVALHSRMAYVPDAFDLWPNLTGGEAIDVLGGLRGGLEPRRRDDLVERFELDPTKRGRAYSSGNRQKVVLIAALAADVELLVLDEPTGGLDPLMEARFQELVRERRDEGVTVLLSSHVLGQVEALCDRVTIIRAGRTVQSGTLAELRHLTRTSITAETARAVTGLDQLTGVHDLEVDRDGKRTHLAVDTEHLDGAVRLLAEHEIESLVSRPPTLEELFIRHYGDEGTARQESDDDVDDDIGS